LRLRGFVIEAFCIAMHFVLGVRVVYRPMEPSACQFASFDGLANPDLQHKPLSGARGNCFMITRSIL
jgi:hypothetical protein